MIPKQVPVAISACLLGVFLGLAQPNSAALTEGESYILWNVATDSYLRVATERPKIREEWSPMYQVVTTAVLDRNDTRFIWKFTKNFEHRDKENRGYLRPEHRSNEVSLFLLERSAYPTYNDLDMQMVNSDSGGRKVTSLSDTSKGPRCLMGHGDDQQITWSECQDTDRQEWHFIKLRLPS